MIKQGQLPRRLVPFSVVMIRFHSISPRVLFKWNRVRGISVNLVMECEMEKENKFGKTILFIKDFGLMMNQMVEVGWSVLMEMFMKDILRVESLMVKEYSIAWMDQLILDSGSMIFSKALEFSNRSMDLDIKESFQKDWNMEEEKPSGVMETHIKDNSGRTLLMVKELWFTQMEKRMKESGKMVGCKEEEFSDGLMANFMKDSLLTTIDMDMVVSN